MTICMICPRQCRLEEGQMGFCGARINRSGEVVSENYGKITSLALDPIEKKPLYRFHPGSKILSVGSYGCNLRCPFCQNHEISMCEKPLNYYVMTPDELVDKAREFVPAGNIGLAYTYNEPLIGWEFVRDCSMAVCEKGLQNVIVTNGYIMEKPFTELLPYLHAANIDLKAYSQPFYRSIGGDLDVVKETIKLAASAIHVEVTTLVIPDENDSEAEIRELSRWLASVDETIPLHLTRYFPTYHMLNHPMTPEETIDRLAGIAAEYLKYVYTGNLGSFRREI